MNQQNENNGAPEEGVRASEKESRTYHTPISEESDDIKEDIRFAGERAAVEKDDKTVKDELEDYVFVNPRRRRHSSSSSSHSSSSSSSSDSLESLLVSESHSHSHHSHSHSHGHSHSHHHHHHHHHHKKKMKKWQKVLITILCVILSLVLLITGTVVCLFLIGNSQLYPSNYNILSPKDVQAEVQDNGHYIVYKGKTYQYNDRVTSLLFMGVDTKNLGDRSDTGTSGQADVIVLMAIDMEKRLTTLIAIPRDTMTDVAEYSAMGTYVGTSTQQICLAYAYGDGKELSCENTVTAAKRMFYNIPIESYYSLDLDGVSVVNDSIGGVDVVSPETIAGFVQGESYHLMGKDAELFIRARDTEKLDASLLRLERQKVYASSFMNKLIAETKKDILTPVNLFNDAADYSCTNIDVTRITALSKDVIVGDGMEFTMVNVPGEMTMGKEYAEYNINPDEFYELFLKVYYNEI